jgi:integrase
MSVASSGSLAFTSAPARYQRSNAGIAKVCRLCRRRNRRHTFGIRWLQAGGDIHKLSKILGHSSVAVTEAHYAHLLKEDLLAASQQVRIPVAPRGQGGNVVRMSGRRRGPA